jgi:putative hydrolase of the HAD superfamily
MIKAVFLDMDDTLIVNQTIYEHATAMLYGYMRHFGVLQEEAQKVFDARDRELFKIHGYSQKRMPASFEAVLKHFVPEADDEMVGIVRSFAEQIFTTIAEVKPGSEEGIKILAAHYPLYFVTGGDREVQERRISHLPFKDKIKGAFIVDKKDPALFERILDELKLKPEEAVMIGDSLKSDIIPSTAAGLSAIWIEAHNSPLHETGAIFPTQGAYKYASFLEAARHLAQYGTPAPVQKPSRPKKISPPQFG